MIQLIQVLLLSLGGVIIGEKVANLIIAGFLRVATPKNLPTFKRWVSSGVVVAVMFVAWGQFNLSAQVYDGLAELRMVPFATLEEMYADYAKGYDWGIKYIVVAHVITGGFCMLMVLISINAIFKKTQPPTQTPE